jgi:uncharacterized membrane protein YhaH (DUF805 family)
MAAAYDFTKLRRLLIIHLVVQIALVALLLWASWQFQQRLADRFLNGVIFSLVIQLGLFFPIKSLTAKEVDREIASSAIELTPADLQALRRKRVTADVIKTSVFLFFLIFIYRLPNKPIILAIAYFSFILTCLSYFQCFNFAARREMRARAGQ